MKVWDIMTRCAISVPADASVLQAGELMVRHDISGLPVTDANGHLVGIVTERDFLRTARTSTGFRRPRWLQLLTGQSMPPAEPERLCERRIADVMTREPATVGEDTALEEVVRIMDSRRHQTAASSARRTIGRYHQSRRFAARTRAKHSDKFRGGESAGSCALSRDRARAAILAAADAA